MAYMATEAPKNADERKENTSVYQASSNAAQDRKQYLSKEEHAISQIVKENYPALLRPCLFL